MKIEIKNSSNVFVDITPYIAFQGVKRGRNDVDGPEAGRTLDGIMHRARVGTKLRYDINCRPLKLAELTALETLIMPEYISVRITDPYYGTVTKTMYSNNTSAGYCIKKKNGTEWWNGITFPLIEV